MNISTKLIFVLLLCFLPAITSYYSFQNQRIEIISFFLVLSPIIFGIGFPLIFRHYFKVSRTQYLLVLGVFSTILFWIESLFLSHSGMILSDADGAIILSMIFIVCYISMILLAIPKNIFFKIISIIWYLVTLGIVLIWLVLLLS